MNDCDIRVRCRELLAGVDGALEVIGHFTATPQQVFIRLKFCQRYVTLEPYESAAEVEARGNLFVWMTGTASIGLLAVQRRRSAMLLVAFTVALWVPWLLLGNAYSFYGSPVVPVLAIATGAALDQFGRPGRWIFAVVVMASAAQFIAAYHLLAGTG